MALSDAWLKANLNKAHEKRFEKSDRDGLSVRVTPKGVIVFQLRYRYNGKAKRCDLGSYPLMSLKEARDEAIRLRTLLMQGEDPKVIKQIKLKEIAAMPTIKELFNEWHVSACLRDKEEKGANEIARSFRLHVMPKFGDLPSVDLLPTLKCGDSY